jgi:hypothetical protein
LSTSSIVLFIPTVSSTRTAARLLDVRRAVRMVREGVSRCSSSGIQPPCGVSTGSSRLVIRLAGVSPDWIAAAKMNGLNADPG